MSKPSPANSGLVVQKREREREIHGRHPAATDKNDEKWTHQIGCFIMEEYPFEFRLHTILVK